MHILRKLFFLQTIYFTQTLQQILTIYILAALLLLLAILIYPWVGVGVIFYLVLLSRTMLRFFIINRQLKQVGLPAPLATKAVQLSSASVELDSIDLSLVIESDSASQIYYAIFNFYTRTKNGSYLSKQAFYTVYEATLDRVLPTVLFDSKKSKRRQFRYLFLKSQRISVQGKFDDYFDTYVPLSYHLDVLSFITPEVMEALLNARHYDIEIVGNKILVYAPFLSRYETNTLKSCGEHLRQQLNDNVGTYRDDRLTGTARVNNVTTFSRTLLKSPIKHVISIVLSAICLGILAYLGMTQSSDFILNRGALFICIWFGISVYQTVYIVRHNSKQLAESTKFYY